MKLKGILRLSHEFAVGLFAPKYKLIA